MNLVFSAYSALSKARALSIGEDPLLCYGGYNSLCPILRPQCCKFSIIYRGQRSFTLRAKCSSQLPSIPFSETRQKGTLETHLPDSLITLICFLSPGLISLCLISLYKKHLSVLCLTSQLCKKPQTLESALISCFLVLNGLFLH